MAGQEDPVQREIHQDWANREYIEIITSSIKKISDFLNSFGQRAGELGRLGGGRRWRRPAAPSPGCSLPLPRPAGPSPLTPSLTRRSRWDYPALCQVPRPLPKPPRPIHPSPTSVCSALPRQSPLGTQCAIVSRSRLQLETPDSSPSPLVASPKPLKCFLSVAPAHPPPPAPFGDNEVRGRAGVLSGLGNAFCNPVSASW